MLFRTFYLAVFLCVTQLLSHAGRVSGFLQEQAGKSFSTAAVPGAEPAGDTAAEPHIGPDPFQFVN